MSGIAASTTTRSLNGTLWKVTLEEGIAELQWAEKGSSLIATTTSGELVAFRTNRERIFKRQAHEGGILRMQCCPGSNVLATSGEEGAVKLWDSATGKHTGTLVQSGSWMDQLVWSHDGGLLAISAGRKISIWRANRLVKEWSAPPGGVGALDWSATGKRLACAVNKGLYLWNMNERAPSRLLSFPGAAVSVAWRADGSALAAGTQDGFLYVWRRHSVRASRQLTMRGYQAKVACLAWHRRRPLIATSGGRDVVLWTLNKAKGSTQSTALRSHKRSVTTLAYQNRGNLLASGDREGRLCLWDAGGKLVHELCADSEITSLAWSPDGDYLALGTRYGSIRLLTVQND